MLDRNMTYNAQEIIKYHLTSTGKEHLVAVDATMGNGFDLEFLALLPQVDTVWGFDVQETAVFNSKERTAYISEKNIHYIQESHHKINDYVESAIDIAMFNLGYLPQGDKEVLTCVDTTLIAIKNVIDKLTIDGILTIMTYPGHDEGAREHQAVETLLNQLSQKKARVLHLSMTNVKKPCPHIFILIK